MLKVNSYINDQGFMSNFNPDLKFVFAFNPGENDKQSFMKFLKKKGSNGYVMDGGVITDAQQVIDNGEVKVSMAMNADDTQHLKQLQVLIKGERRYCIRWICKIYF